MSELSVLGEVGSERRRQDAKWGEQNHGPMPWSAILGEEFGEACQAGLLVEFGPESSRKLSAMSLREELLQVAAVAVAWIECLDRNDS